MAESDKATQAEAEAIRRRWITLGEVLAVAAVLISGLTLWNSYSERRAAETERQAERAQSSREAASLVLRAFAADRGQRLVLTAPDEAVVIQSQTFRFPAALDIDAVETVVDPRIEAGWIEAAAGRLARDDKAGAGDRLLPVLITTRFSREGEMRSDTGLYDIGYQVEGGGLFDDREVRLRGLSQIERVAPGQGQARLDALWAKRQPTISSGLKK